MIKEKNQKKSHSLCKLKPFVKIPTIFLELTGHLHVGLVINRLHGVQILLTQVENYSGSNRVSKNIDGSPES